MRWQMFVLLALVLGMVATGRGLAADKQTPLAGWFGVVPDMPGYQRTFDAPVVVNKAKPTTYRQNVRYEWTGGAIRRLTVTLARDPALKKDHAAETLRKATPAPREVKVGKKTAWLSVMGVEGIEQVHKLVIPLAEDKAVVVEAKGQFIGDQVTAFAEKLDLTAIATALDKPPRTQFKKTVDAFRNFKKGTPMSDVYSWVGSPDADVGKGKSTHIMEYKLPDGSRVLIGTPDWKTLQYVKHEKDSKTEELTK